MVDKANSRKRTTGKKKVAKKRPRRRTPRIFIVSDGRGDTCSQLVHAAALQFEGQHYKIELRGNVRTTEDVERVMLEAAAKHAVVFYTLVAGETRDAMKREANKRLVPTVDVIGPAYSALHDLFRTAPRAEPGLLYASDRERYDVHTAIDYTLKHDDGQRPNELGKADVVLVGVSRASKSSTCFYLACEGIKAANVPLIPGIEPPSQLLKMDPTRVIGLRVNVMRLMTVREARASAIRLHHSVPYLDKRTIAREVNEANRIMDAHGWSSFDASYLAIEEIAKQVIEFLGLRTRGFR
jgi:regulator of PEP synthase PpsR (kinase-PPPase family)